MKKLLLIPIFLYSLTFQAQFNEDAPWIESINTKRAKSSNPVTFKEIITAFDSYWETRDPNVRGSGYKPFKRWENHWKNYVKEDGTLPSAAEIWNTTLEAKQAKSSLADLSNWISLGPSDFANRSTSYLNIGRVNAIIVDPNNSNTYYSGAPAGGIWKSTDSGATWIPLGDNLPQIGVSGIAIDFNNSNIIYVATGDDDGGDTSSVGVLKSIDGGLTWNTTGLNTTNSPTSMNDIYISPSDSNTIWVATNNGVYKTGFSRTQSSYDDAVQKLFSSLEMIENKLEHQDYLVGNILTEADIRFVPTLLRFDSVYYVHFKCSLKKISEFKNISRYLKNLYSNDAISSTTNFEHIKRHYYFSHEHINPHRIIPIGPENLF